MSTDNERYVDYFGSSKSSWKRPEGPPRVWRVFDGRRKTASGEIPRFSIQEVPKELEDDVIDFMAKYFLTEEPINVYQGLAEDPIAVRECRTLWKDVMRHGISIVALTMNADPHVKPAIAGVNLMDIVTAEDEANSDGMTQCRSKSMKKLSDMMNKLTKEVDIFKKYGIDKYLFGYGLSVDPCLRGQGLGEEILRARDDLGRAYKIPVCETVFTATASQILATRVGYENLVERKYSELLDDEGKVTFPGIKVEFIKLMAKKIY